MKKFIVVALIILMCVPFSAFAGGGRDRGGDDGRLRVGVSLGPANNAWHAKLREVIDDAVSHHPDIEWTVRNAQSAADQLNMLTVFMNEDFDAILIMPTDGNLLAPISEQIFRNGTRTIILNRAIASQNYTAFVAGDNFGAGVNAARFTGQRLNGQGNIAYLRSHAGTPIDMERNAGFMSTLTREFPNIRILVEGDGEFNREAGLRAMTNILPAFPQIDAVITHDDEAALGAITAIEAANRTDIRFVTGMGGTRPAYERLRDNDRLFAASMSYFPAMGYDGIEMVVRVLRGIPFPKDTLLSSVIVSRDNVMQFWDDSY